MVISPFILDLVCMSHAHGDAILHHYLSVPSRCLHLRNLFYAAYRDMVRTRARHPEMNAISQMQVLFKHKLYTILLYM
jgi:hypothetical protein